MLYNICYVTQCITYASLSHRECRQSSPFCWVRVKVRCYRDSTNLFCIEKFWGNFHELVLFLWRKLSKVAGGLAQKAAVGNPVQKFGRKEKIRVWRTALSDTAGKSWGVNCCYWEYAEGKEDEEKCIYIYIFFFTLHVYHKRLMGHIPIVKLGSVLILLRALKRVFSQPSEWNTGRNARAAQSCIVKMIQQA